jgi:hypothetical protein
VYIATESSGYAVQEIGRLVRTQDEVLPALGLVANCQAARLAALPRPLICYPIRWDGTSQDELMQEAERHAADSAIYVVAEDLSYLDIDGLPQPKTVLATVKRPGELSVVYLYRIEQGARRPEHAP